MKEKLGTMMHVIKKRLSDRRNFRNINLMIVQLENFLNETFVIAVVRENLSKVDQD